MNYYEKIFYFSIDLYDQDSINQYTSDYGDRRYMIMRKKLKNKIYKLKGLFLKYQINNYDNINKYKNKLNNWNTKIIINNMAKDLYINNDCCELISKFTPKTLFCDINKEINFLFDRKNLFIYHDLFYYVRTTFGIQYGNNICGNYIQAIKYKNKILKLLPYYLSYSI